MQKYLLKFLIAIFQERNEKPKIYGSDNGLEFKKKKYKII